MKGGDDGLDKGTVKTGKKLMSIPAGQTRVVKCCARAGPLPECQDALFEPNPPSQLPEGLEVQESVIITNNTAHEMFTASKNCTWANSEDRTIYAANTSLVIRH